MLARGVTSVCPGWEQPFCMIRAFSELWFFSLKIGSIDLESSVVMCIKHTGVPCVFLGFFSSIQVFSECVADDKNLGTLYGPRVQLAEM